MEDLEGFCPKKEVFAPQKEKRKRKRNGRDFSRNLENRDQN